MMDWSPSQTDVFPGRWTTLSTFSTSPASTESQRTMHSTQRMDPNSALRSPRKRSGLFDRELTDFSLEECKSVAQDDQQQTTFNDENQSVKLAGDLDLDFPSQSDWMDLFGGVDCGALDTPEVDKVDQTTAGCNLFPFTSGSFDEIGEDLMENFTDLSTAILGVDPSALSQTVAEMTQEAGPSVLSSTAPIIFEESVAKPSTSRKNKTPRSAPGRRSLKRRAKEAELEEESVAVVPCEPLPVANHDHDAYTKRPRLSTASLEEEEDDGDSEAESVATCSSSTTTTNKYVERRKKNNVASRRSRKSRKDKFQAMEERVEILEQDNRLLEEKVELMESLAKALKQHLVTRLAK